MASQASLDMIQKVYIAYYGRPADPLGQVYWADRLESEGGSLDSIIDAFGNSAEAEALYGGMTEEQTVETLYQQLFDREADFGGLTFYANGLRSGDFTLATIALNILNGATGGDVTIIAAKLAAANAFTAEIDTTHEVLGYSGDVAADAARDYLDGVVDTATANAAIATVEDTLAAIVDPVVPVPEGEEFTLTVETDHVVGTASDDVIIGSSLSYQPADTIDGGAGEGDRLFLDLKSSDSLYDVGSVTNVEEVFVNTLESNVEGADDVAMLMSNYEGLQTLTVEQSRADIRFEDLQTDVDVVINDMRADVAINIDAQNAVGPDDEIDVSIREFGDTASGVNASDYEDEADIDGAAGEDDAGAPTNGDAGNYDADLTIDEAIEIVNLTDAGEQYYENDLSIAGGFRQLNIDGGVAGVDLTIHDVNSTSFEGYDAEGDGVTVDATEFLGDLTIDADAVDVLDTGAGDDTITTDMAYGGAIDAGNGDNAVTIGSLMGEDAADDDLTGSVTTGSGMDTVLVDDDSSGAISTGAGADYVEIGADLDGEDGEGDSIGWDTGDLEEGGTIATGAGADTVVVNDDAYGDIDTGLASDTTADGDTVTVGDDVGDNADITTGAGADTVSVAEYMSGTITTGTEGDIVTVGEDVYGQWYDLASITTEAGDDDVTVGGALLDDSLISTGADNDDVIIGAGIQDAQDHDGLFADDDVDALVDLGSGNDELVVTGTVAGDVVAGSGDDDILVIDGDVYGNIVTVAEIDGGTGSDTLTLLDQGEDSTDVMVADDYADITGIETLNLVDEVASGEDDFDIDLAAFDGDLADVNIVKEGSGNSETNLYNVAGEQISISAEDNVVETDVTLNVTSDASSLAVALESNIDGNILDEGLSDLIDPPVAAGNTDFDVVIDDLSGTISDLNLENNGEAVSDDVFWDGYEKGRTVTLDGEDFAGSLTITGDMANDREGYAESDELRQLNQQDGNLLLVSGIAADDIDSAEYAGDVNLVLAVDQSHDITLGSGDDVVNLLADNLDVGDTIEFGDGVDRLIVNEDTQTTGDDSDEVFGELNGLEELEVRGDGGIGGGEVDGLLEVSLDDDAYRSDIARVIVDADGMTDANVLLDIGADWERALRVDVFNGSVEINNDSAEDLTIFTDASDNGRDILIDNNQGGTSQVYIGIDAGEDATIASGDAFDLAFYTEDAFDTGFGYGSDGEVELDAQTGVITNITLLDNGGAENGDILLTVADAWAKTGSLTIDASDISDDDLNDDTGGLTLRGGLEDDATLTVIGTDNDDVILGGQLGDTLSGGLGDDLIIGDPTGPVLPGVQQVSTVVFAEDVLEDGDVYTVTLDGEDYSYTSDGEDGIDDAGAAIAALIEADGDLDAAYDADTNTLTVTGNDTYEDEATGVVLPMGESFTIGASATNFPVTSEVKAVTLANETYDAGDQIVIDIGGAAPVPFTVTVTSAGGSQAAVLAEVIAAFNLDANAIAQGYTASASAVAGQLLISAPADGVTEFSLTASVTDVAPTAEEVQFTLAGMDLAGESASITVDGVAYGVVFDTDNATTAASLALAIDAAVNVTAAAVGGVITITGTDGDLVIGGYSAVGGTLTYDGVQQEGVTAAELTDNTNPTDNGELVDAAPAGVIANTAPVVATTIDAVAAIEPDSEGGGADTIDGGEGDNELYGVVGDDVITAGSGNNYVEGGIGNDTITLGNGTNEIYGDAGNDVITAGLAGTNLVDGFTYVEGGLGNDTITLGDGGSEVYGDASGSALGGSDTIVTGAGNDTIEGGFGADSITAGAGYDTFAYSYATDSTGADLGFDTLYGVQTAYDAFDLTELAADLGYTGVTFLGNFENENTANTAIDVHVGTTLEVVFVEYTAGDGQGYIYADTNNSGDIDTADLAIKVVDLVGTLTDGNFYDIT